MLQPVLTGKRRFSLTKFLFRPRVTRLNSPSVLKNIFLIRLILISFILVIRTSSRQSGQCVPFRRFLLEKPLRNTVSWVGWVVLP